jgi:hypothetical protein
MGEMGEAALENGWPFFTSPRCDEVAEKNVCEKREKLVRRRGKRRPAIKKWVKCVKWAHFLSASSAPYCTFDLEYLVGL